MKKFKSFGLFLLLILAYCGWQLSDQFDVLAANLGLPVSSKLSVEDQYLIS
jgi:hypothetical protein